MYGDFKDFDFEILGFSLGNDTEKWNRAIIKDELIWENVVDTLNFKGMIFAKYNIS